MLVAPEAELRGVSADDALERVLADVPVPRAAAEVADGPRIGVPELTGRGWTLIGGAGGLVVAGKLFGSDALTATGLAAGFALLLALAWVPAAGTSCR